MVHDLGGAVHGGGREAIGERAVEGDRLHGRIVVVERVGPHPGGGERERAVAVGACGRGANHLPGVGRIVDVGRIEVAGRGRRAGSAVVDATGLHHRPGGIAGDHRGVVGAGDGDGDKLRRRSAVAVVDLDRIGLHQLLADPERLPQRVVGREQPGHLSDAVAGGVVGHVGDEGPEVAAAPGRHRRDVSVGEVDVAEVDRAVRRHHRQRPFRYRCVVHCSGHYRRVIGAGDGDGDELSHLTAMVVRDDHCVGLCQLQAFRQELQRRGCRRKRPRHLTDVASSGVIVQIRDERAKVALLVRNDRYAVRVAEAEIRELDCSRCHGRRRILGRTSMINGRRDERIAVNRSVKAEALLLGIPHYIFGQAVGNVG